MILLLDNWDSFTYNLYQYVCELSDEEVRVVRNNELTVDEACALEPSRLIISPGPGRPEDAGIAVELVRRLAGRIPILGVCLGHQAIAAAFGGQIVAARHILHGKTDTIRLDGRGLFRSIASPATYVRYHSLVVERDSLPDELEISAENSDGDIMGIRVARADAIVEGVQFHPESIAGEDGHKLLNNFLHYRRHPFVVARRLEALLATGSMSRGDAAAFMQELTDGNLTAAQIGAFLSALNAGGITAEEIAGCAEVLMRKRTPLQSSRPLLDTCGTGGDGLGAFNISSMSALVAAACGASVAKHGNRAISSQSGSADFYRALGLKIDLGPAQSSQLLEQTGFAFLFAPIYHGAMRHAAQPRRELGVKTIMNLLGPLVNPAGARYQLIGVYDDGLCETLARAARLLGIERVAVVHAEDGADELSIAAPTQMVVFDGTIAAGAPPRVTIVDPRELGLSGYETADMAGGSAEENAEEARRLMAGTGSAALRDAVVLNCAAALQLCGVAADLRDGMAHAAEALASGAVQAKLEEIITLTRRLAAEHPL